MISTLAGVSRIAPVENCRTAHPWHSHLHHGSTVTSQHQSAQSLLQRTELSRIRKQTLDLRHTRAVALSWQQHPLKDRICFANGEPQRVPAVTSEYMRASTMCQQNLRNIGSAILGCKAQKTSTVPVCVSFASFVVEWE